jgi:rhodanese/phosphatase family protein
LTETRVVVVCAECRAHWYSGSEPAKCANPGHEHQRFELHTHRSTVTLPDGTSVVAVSFDDRDPYGRDREPEYGLYLDPVWQPPWPHDHLDWPDFGVPADASTMGDAMRSVLDRARAGRRVEVGCLGGHGRTGTALACLAVLSGVPSKQAVAWVRANYCPAAVERQEQEAFVAGFRPPEG